MDARRRAPPALALVGAALLAALAAPAPADRPLSERVVIRRDTFGVPHVLAEDEEAAAFGLGFAMAEDHAAEMGRRYLAARGESARHFGEEGIEDDFAALRLDTRLAARRAVWDLGPGFRRWLTGFTAGYYLFDGRPLPIKSRRFTVQVDQEDGSLHSVSRDFDETHLGPVVHRTADRLFAVRSAALGGWRHFEGFYELAHARSLREYLRVVRRGGERLVS